jgi:hypothetical protein
MNRGKSFMASIIPWPMLPQGAVVVLLVVVLVTVVVLVAARGSNNGGEYNRMEYQLCGENGHTATGSYDVDTTWYVNSGATDHITGELEKLTARGKYFGNDQIHTTSGLGMRITQVGKSVIHIPHQDISLDNVLYVLEANKNLVSVHRFTHDNHVYLELHPWHFLIKDRATMRILHHGKVEGGLYPLKSSERQVLAVTKPSQVRWHSHLGHPSLQVVRCVLSQIFLFPLIPLIRKCVMRVLWARLINCLTQSLRVYPKFLWNLFF